MPERPLTIATYAASASLAAIALVYVFGPTFFLDDDAANSTRSSRKRGVVGLVNPANDCFINSVLQALAGLPELRLYLIREVHQRDLDGTRFYSDISAALEAQAKQPDAKKRIPEWRLVGLQRGEVTEGLKLVLDALNERPIYKKTITAQPFIRCLEDAFRTRVSRQQQDAQELLQVVTERLLEEFLAGRAVRKAAGKKAVTTEVVLKQLAEDRGSDSPQEATISSIEEVPEKTTDGNDAPESVQPNQDPPRPSEEERSAAEAEEPTNFPFEGKLESVVECSYCHFKPKPAVSSFTTLTLHVPQHLSTTTLATCFDSMLKIEHIEDFKCDRCRLAHAIEVNAKQLSRSNLAAEERSRLEQDRSKIQASLDEDPETPPKNVKLPDLSTAPKRKITRHMRIAHFPRVLAIHLSRSVWDPHSVSTKNVAKVSFPEMLPLGGLLDRQNYRLHCVVTHKGGHNSGHYESFRRQVLREPFSTPASMGKEGVYSRRDTPLTSPQASAAPSPQMSMATTKTRSASTGGSAAGPETPSTLTPSSSSASSRSQHSVPLARRKPPPRTSTPLDAIPTPGLPTPPPERHTKSGGEETPKTRPASSAATRTAESITKLASGVSVGVGMGGMRRPPRRGDDRWWRISDESIKEAKTADVLKMQREVYLLFYEVMD